MSANLLKLHLTCSFLPDLTAYMTHAESDHLNKLQPHWEHANLFLSREESLALKITVRKCAHRRPLKRRKGEDVTACICYNTQRMWLKHIFNYPRHPEAGLKCVCVFDLNGSNETHFHKQKPEQFSSRKSSAPSTPQLSSLSLLSEPFGRGLQ